MAATLVHQNGATNAEQCYDSSHEILSVITRIISFVADLSTIPKRWLDYIPVTIAISGKSPPGFRRKNLRHYRKLTPSFLPRIPYHAKINFFLLRN
jgi:hypothetical protein